MNEILPEVFANLTPEVITNLFICLKKTEHECRKTNSEDSEPSEAENVEKVTPEEDYDYIFEDNISFSESHQNIDDFEDETDIGEGD